MGMVASLGDPKISRHLLRDEGEVIVDEVRKHWVVYLGSAFEFGCALALVVSVSVLPANVGWLPLLIAFGLTAHAVWKALDHHRDRFVITNMRVFRVHGVIATHLATMPLSRILDISVVKPLHGRFLGFGHFVFESAAQEQGLREIRYVGDPDARDLAIQRVVQRAGLRGPRNVN